MVGISSIYDIYFLFGFIMISVRNEYFEALDKIRISSSILTPILAVSWFIIEHYKRNS